MAGSTQQTKKLSAVDLDGHQTTIVQAPRIDRAYWAKQGVILLLLAGASGLLCWGGGYLSQLEYVTLDLRFYLTDRLEDALGRSAPSSKVIVVAIDDKSIQAVPERWPWNRRFLGTLIDALAKDGASTIAVDLIVGHPARYDLNQDKALVEATGRAGNVVMIVDRSHQGDWRQTRLPIPALRPRLAAMGHTWFGTDKRGVCRFVRLARSPEAPTMEAFVMEALRVHKGAPRGWASLTRDFSTMILRDSAGPIEVPVKNGYAYVNYRCLKRIPSRSFIDVIRGKTMRGTFRNKIVMVGATSTLLHDHWLTPTSGKVGGVFIHAAMAEGILSGDNLARPGIAARLLATLFSLCLALGAALQRNRATALLVLVSVCAFSLAMGAITLLKNIWLPLLPIVAGSWVFHYLWMSAVSIHQTRAQGEAVRRLMDAGRMAKVDLKVVDEVNAMFGLNLQSGEEDGPTTLPTGMQILASFLDAEYRNIAIIGKGGMGLVVKAEDSRRGQVVAIKIMSPFISDDKLSRKRFLREIEVMAQLDHPNIVKIFEAGEGDFPYYAMEYLRGESLRTRIHKRGNFSFSEALDLFGPIALGLGYAHDKGIIHRDVKPENIFIDKDGTPKLLDFGLAHVAEHTKLTKSGYVLGTLRYMAPEQLSASLATPATDVFAMGVTLLEAVLGTNEFLYRYGNDVVSRMKVANLPGEADLLEPLIACCLDPDPRERPVDGTALASELAALSKDRRKGEA